ncbi:hypothetical protein [Methanothermococcus okinawensis]|uniref:Metanogen output domain-containing protein n=1 Tax=Methanothermococcus okinawensis (strain DSM 14208 / JCM 11175 / IH1) TaxID=647113 RepID=F8AJP2_METOI|nr:hypothetical protein [Methanothermococcus okinawensis]AEH07237.1 hypothetical protein Metok_1269 [Methanothermococcus okinawensis IH1]
MVVDSYKKLVEDRHLKNLHIVLTSLMAELSKIGILNQGTTNVVGEGVGKKVARCIKDIHPDIPNDEKELIKFLIKFCDMCDDYIVEDEIIGIKSDKCRYCPKQIGEAEIPGSACPIPSMIVSMLNELNGKKTHKIHLINGKILMKKDGYCWFKIK